MKTSNTRKSRVTSLILILSLVLLFLCITCRADWYDDGNSYLCPDCEEYAGAHWLELAPCMRCQVNMTHFYYCYDCAKELDCCQRCQRER